MEHTFISISCDAMMRDTLEPRSVHIAAAARSVFAARALVLQGHESVGALAVQELVASGVEVSVQVPPTEESETELHAAIERVKGWGVRDVKSMDPLAAIESCADDEFDFVIDKVGGRDLWHACRRILHNSGQVRHFSKLCCSRMFSSHDLVYHPCRRLR